MMTKQPTLEELDIIAARMHARLAVHSELMARWFTETLATMEARFSAGADDPAARAEARASALVFVKAMLKQWAVQPPHAPAVRLSASVETPPVRRPRSAGR